MLTFSINASNNTMQNLGKLQTWQAHTDAGSEWLGNTILKVLSNKIKRDITKLNLDSYGKGCARNITRTQKTDVALLSTEDIAENEKGVSDLVAVYIDTNIDNIVNKAEYVTIVEDLIEMQEYLLLEEGISLLKVIKLAYKGHFKGMQKLKYLIEEYSLKNLIQILFMNIDCYNLLYTVSNQRNIIY